MVGRQFYFAFPFNKKRPLPWLLGHSSEGHMRCSLSLFFQQKVGLSGMGKVRPVAMPAGDRFEIRFGKVASDELPTADKISFTTIPMPIRYPRAGDPELGQGKFSLEAWRGENGLGRVIS